MDWKPQILDWVADAHRQAILESHRPAGSKYKAMALDKAYRSIENNTTEIIDPKDLIKLPNVGERTVALIITKIEKWCHQNNCNLPPSLEPPAESDTTNENAKREPKTLAKVLNNQSYPFAPPPMPEKKKGRDYIPKYGSAPYYVITTMRLNELTDPSCNGVGQSELQRLIKPRVQGVLEGAVSRSSPAIGAALKTLRKYEYIYLQNSRIFLDTPGRELATKLLKASGEWSDLYEVLNDSDLTDNSARTESITPMPSESPYEFDEWEPGSFNIKLLVDNREVASKKDRAGLVNDLRSLGLNLEVQTLSLGDCLWVAEHASGRRAVLDWIVERKTLGDLRSSIHDGRYHDQKKRLLKSTLQNIVYLVEFPNNATNNVMFEENRRKFITAMSQTLVNPKFHLKITRSQNETVQHIALMTRIIIQKFTNSPLRVIVPQLNQFEMSMNLARASDSRSVSRTSLAIDFSAFHEGLTKSKLKTIGETFRLMLRTIKGISAAKAMSIQRVYPTPSHLRQAYLNESSEEVRKLMISDATKNFLKVERIMPSISEKIYEVWCP